MVRKCRGIAEIAVVGVAAAQVGVRTRARAALATAAASSSATAKKRKVNNTTTSSSQLKFSSPSSRYVQLRSRRSDLIAPQQQNSISPAAPEESVVRRTPVENYRCPSPTSSGAVSASCCSSNGSSEVAKEGIDLVDLEDEGGEVETSTYYCCRERTETTPSRAESDELESTARPTEADSGRGSAAEKMPTESELEEFFAGPEKEMQKRFAEKYNYDIVKHEPLEEGRYEWSPLKP